MLLVRTAKIAFFLGFLSVIIWGIFRRGIGVWETRLLVGKTHRLTTVRGVRIIIGALLIARPPQGMTALELAMHRVLPLLISWNIVLVRFWVLQIIIRVLVLMTVLKITQE